MAPSTSCASCGKGGNDLKACPVCKQASYCNATCRKKHRSTHKKECKAAAKALDNAAANKEFDIVDIPEEDLYKDPPPREECPICMLPMPFTCKVFDVVAEPMSCCGATICTGCIGAAEKAMASDDIKRWCLFCREPEAKSDEEELQRIRKRAELGDGKAFYKLGCAYQEGKLGTRSPQDKEKMLDMWTQAAKLGDVQGHYGLGITYYLGKMVPHDASKARYHLSIAAMGGHELARFTLGLYYSRRGRVESAMKHFLISARNGGDSSLEKLGEGYKLGHVSKEDYENALRAHKQSRDDLKSDQRDEYAKESLMKLRMRFPHLPWGN